MNEKITPGLILKNIRIRCEYTLRSFCQENNLDPIRYSLIERNKLKPTLEEFGYYINLISKK